MENQINKALEEARLYNQLKTELELDLQKFIEENYIIENGIIKERKDAGRDTSKTNETPNTTGI